MKLEDPEASTNAMKISGNSDLETSEDGQHRKKSFFVETFCVAAP